MTTAITVPCRACDGQGGFNRFVETQVGGGTATVTVHQWIVCSLCNGTGKETA